MIIRREDFGKLEDLSYGSNKKIWFTCESCGIGILQSFKNYNNQKDGKFCRSCRNSLSAKKCKDKVSESMKKLWKDKIYRRKMSKKLSESCKKAWDNEERRKWFSENNPMYNEDVVKKVTESEATSIDELKKICKKYNYEFLERILGKPGGVVIKIKCENGHVIEKRLDVIKRGNPGCSECMKKFSSSEKEISEYIKNLGFKIIENDRKIIYPYELDIIIPDRKMAIEYCGLYWHGEKRKPNKNYHLDKLNKCKENGYNLITIFEDEWLNKNNIVRNRLKYMLCNNTDRIYARNCGITEISSKTAKEFVDNYHLQGYVNCKVKLGAYNEGRLVSVMTFSKPSISKGRKDQKGLSWELSRFCSSCNVVGIASKLLSYFKNVYEWDEIYSYADKRWSDGNLYEKIGFDKVDDTKPNYWYFHTIDKGLKKYHRFNFRKDKLNKLLENFDGGKTEYQNMLDNGWDRIWDCGNFKFIIKK